MEPVCFYPKLNFTFDSFTVDLIRVIAGPILEAIPPHKHGHNNFEIHLITAGSGWIQLADQRQAVTAGDLFVTGPGILHSQFSNPAQPMVEYCLNLTISAQEQQAQDLLSALTTFSRPEMAQFGVLCQQLTQELTWQRPFYQELARALTQTLLVELFRLVAVASAEPAPSKAEITFAERALLIDQYFISCPPEASLFDLAQQLHLSIRQTQRILQQSFGSNFQQKLAEARSAKAKIMLVETEMPIGTIARLLGFSSLEHFSQAFKKNNGCAPSRYRQKY